MGGCLLSLPFCSVVFERLQTLRSHDDMNDALRSVVPPPLVLFCEWGGGWLGAWVVMFCEGEWGWGEGKWGEGEWGEGDWGERGSGGADVCG